MGYERAGDSSPVPVETTDARQFSIHLRLHAKNFLDVDALAELCQVMVAGTICDELSSDVAEHLESEPRTNSRSRSAASAGAECSAGAASQSTCRPMTRRAGGSAGGLADVGAGRSGRSALSRAQVRCLPV